MFPFSLSESARYDILSRCGRTKTTIDYCKEDQIYPEPVENCVDGITGWCSVKRVRCSVNKEERDGEARLSHTALGLAHGSEWNLRFVKQIFGIGPGVNIGQHGARTMRIGHYICPAHPFKVCTNLSVTAGRMISSAFDGG